MRFARPGQYLAIAGVFLLLGFPAGADEPLRPSGSAASPFLSTSPPPAPVKRPHHSPAAAEPAPAEAPPAALPAAPSMFPPDMVSRIKQVAQFDGIGVPDTITFAEAATPAAYRNLLGAWGPSTWTGGTRYLLLILAVDAAGNAEVVRAYNACCSNRLVHPAGWHQDHARFVSGKLLLDYASQFGAGAEVGEVLHQEYALTANDWLHGMQTGGEHSVSIDLPRFK